jgi:hypothetical protein
MPARPGVDRRVGLGHCSGALACIVVEAVFSTMGSVALADPPSEVDQFGRLGGYSIVGFAWHMFVVGFMCGRRLLPREQKWQPPRTEPLDGPRRAPQNDRRRPRRDGACTAMKPTPRSAKSIAAE